MKTKNVPEVLKLEINPTFFLITGVSQAGGGGPPLGNFSHIIPFFSDNDPYPDFVLQNVLHLNLS